MVGRFLGASALGRLTVSQTLVYLPFNRIAGPIQEVMFPAFSRMQDEPARILGALNRINQVLAAIAFPTLTGLAILAPEFTAVVLGPKWAGTEEVIRVLALAGMALALQRVNFSVLSARGYARLIMWVGAGALASTVAAILVAYPFGLVATVAALAAQTLVLQAVIMSVTAGALDARFRDLARPLARIAVATGVMAASCRPRGGGIARGRSRQRRYSPGRDRHGSGGVRPAPAPAGAWADRVSSEASRATVAGQPIAREQAPSGNGGGHSFQGGTHLDEPSHVERSSPSSPSGSPFGTERRPSPKRSNRYWRRRSRTGSSSSPTTCRRTVPRRSAPRSQHATSVFAISRRAATSRLHENFRAAFQHSRGTYFRWHGDDDWLEPEYAERAVAALAASPGSVLCTTIQQYYRDGHPLPVNDPLPVLGGVDSTDPADREFAPCSTCSRDGGHLGIDPVYSLVRRDVAAQTRPSRLHP